MDKLGPGDPREIGAYRLLARLGAGGMGQVYLARSDRGRTVAVKLVRGELARQEEFRARFRQEVRSARQVGGDWTAPVLDADTEAPVPWVATGYVAGPSLQQVVGHDHGALPERSVRILAAGLAHALKDIHAAGIIHRDLKPSNVLVTIDGPRVIDFGIARALETVTDGGLTRTGALVGSPGFMAPEQVRGDRITPACDVFCLGSVLAYAATGTYPFGTANSGVHALMFRIAQEEPDLERVPEGLADLVRDCLRKDPAARPTLNQVLQRTGADDTVAGGRSRDPWLPSALVAQLGRHAVRLLDAEDPAPAPATPAASRPGGPPASAPQSPAGHQVPPGSGHPGVPAQGGPAGPDASAVPAAGQPDGPPASAPGAGQQTPGVPAPGDQAPPGPAYPGAPPQGGPAGGAPAGHPGGPAAVVPGPAYPGTPAAGHPAVTPEHARATDDSAVPPPPPPGVNHLPTLVAGQGAPVPVPAPGPYGHPQQPAYGYPYSGGHGPGQTPPYGPPPYLPAAPAPRRDSRSTVLLVVIALVVALAAGGTVYALMSGGDTGHRAGGDPTTPPPTSAGATQGAASDDPSPTRQPSTSAPADGTVPADYLGSWSTTIDNASGEHTRTLTIQQGEVGDTVMSLVADGPAGSGTYHCVFEARLTADPGSGGRLELGPSSVTVGEPRSACTPGAASTITLLSGDSLQRVNTGTGEQLTYTRG
ncbi:serine/threonine-protein kinase [Streptomyces edwardsiae]|uniref:Protein kinase n=1 Tax=Streptomyces edwardsiae TaxID=3075527 RepID=A0ABU2QTJ1_9ACTN|nr:protein kinase [Streptomyces sp. DSM 41635]MDT0406604.1 protein kinase [Streptomyces sp. DSM 41635]